MVIQRGKLKDFPLFLSICVQFKYVCMINNSRAVIYEISFHYSKWYIYVLFRIVFFEGTENICLKICSYPYVSYKTMK